MAVAQRITVTLPDALHERLQRVKEALNGLSDMPAGNRASS
jgi:hypothetical protein